MLMSRSILLPQLIVEKLQLNVVTFWQQTGLQKFIKIFLAQQQIYNGNLLSIFNAILTMQVGTARLQNLVAMFFKQSIMEMTVTATVKVARTKQENVDLTEMRNLVL